MSVVHKLIHPDGRVEVVPPPTYSHARWFRFLTPEKQVKALKEAEKK